MKTYSWITGCIVMLFVVGLAPKTYAADIVFCAQKSNGLLRLVDSPSECQPSERVVLFERGARVVHGVIGSDGSIKTGTGFTIYHGKGTYEIVFTTPFPSTPTCLVAAQDHGYPNVICGAVPGYASDKFKVFCQRLQTVFAPDIVPGVPTSVLRIPINEFVDTTFSFVCIENR